MAGRSAGDDSYASSSVMWNGVSSGLEPQYGVTPSYEHDGQDGDEPCEAAPSLVSIAYSKHGMWVARHSKLTMILCTLFLAALSAGCSMMTITNDPQKLWSPPNSITGRQQQDFNDKFGKFFRIEQIIATKRPAAAAKSTNMLEQSVLSKLLKLQEAIINTPSNDGGVLEDFCYEPIRGKGCIIETPLDYWRSDEKRISNLNYQSIQAGIACETYESKIGCMSNIGVPIIMDAVFGGLECTTGPNSTQRYFCPGDGCDRKASALMITFLLNDEKKTESRAERWEKEVFLRLASEFYDPEIQVTYMAQRSVSDALGVVDSQNKFVVLFSYVAMFAYIVFALGKFPHPVKSRIFLGLQGIIMVAASVSSSIGIVSYFGMDITMIVTEVVPFLILAIGVDNMFIITKTWDKRRAAAPKEPVEVTCACTMAEVGPTITAAATSEVLAFAVGATTDIPALQGFCVVAAVAVFIDFLLQITWFAAAVAIDDRRMRSNRADVAPCVTVEPETASEGEFWDLINRGQYVRTFMEKIYAPILMNPVVKVIVLILWGFFLGISIYGAGQLKLGLEQQLVLPKNSYLRPYFDQQSILGEAGPPAYIVLQNVDYETDPYAAKTAIDKLVNGLTQQSGAIERPVTNWFDHFQVWDSAETRATLQKCVDTSCPTCVVPYPPTVPLAKRVQRFLYDVALNSSCCQSMGHCGAQFAPDVKFLWYYNETTKTKEPLYVMASRLRTQHTPVSTQADFIRDMQTTQHMVKALSGSLPQVDFSKLNLPKNPVIPPPSPNDPNDQMHYTWSGTAPGGKAYGYSLFYVYYEQYNFIRGVAVQSLLLSLGAVFVSVLFISSPSVAFFVVLSVACVAIDLIGFLWALNPPHDNYPAKTGEFGVDINAVSVVNMVMAVGLAVEFCVHIATHFMSTRGTRNDRAKAAVTEMGSAVITGITCTKFVGVLVLAWAPSHLFRLYYFRMYVGIIVSGAFHGLVFLPVLLSLVGPEPTVRPKAMLSNAKVIRGPSNEHHSLSQGLLGSDSYGGTDETSGGSRY